MSAVPADLLGPHAGTVREDRWSNHPPIADPTIAPISTLSLWELMAWPRPTASQHIFASKQILAAATGGWGVPPGPLFVLRGVSTPARSTHD